MCGTYICEICKHEYFECVGEYPNEENEETQCRYCREYTAMLKIRNIVVLTRSIRAKIVRYANVRRTQAK